MFFKIGGFTIGGGYAMLPLIQEEVVDKRGWASHEEMLDYYAIGQCTPGIIAINTATFVGHKRRGILGGIFATLGMVTPSLIIITLISKFFGNIQNNIYIQHAFSGIRAGVVALILNTVIGMYNKSIKDRFGFLIFLMGFIIIAFLQISPIWVILIASVLGAIKGRNMKIEEL